MIEREKNYPLCVSLCVCFDRPESCYGEHGLYNFQLSSLCELFLCQHGDKMGGPSLLVCVQHLQLITYTHTHAPPVFPSQF